MTSQPPLRRNYIILVRAQPGFVFSSPIHTGCGSNGMRVRLIRWYKQSLAGTQQTLVT